MRKLSLLAYRNYSNCVFEFDKSCIVLYGANGSGKTNLLEAISLLSPGRGLRRASYQQMCCIGQENGFVINANLTSSVYGKVNIGTGLRPAALSRQVHINAAPALIEKLTQYCRILWLTPLMDKLFIGPYSDRRRFLDRLILAINPGHGAAVRDYEKMMRSRNYLLQEPQPDVAALDSYEASMAQLAVRIAGARNNFIAMLSDILPNHCLIETKISVKGDCETQLLQYGETETMLNMQQELQANRAKDRALGRCAVGPHRSDFCIKYAKKDMAAELCSSGEQKALLLNLILAQAELTKQVSGMTPILLFDEISAYLDVVNKNALLNKIQNYNGQIIITATDCNLFSQLKPNAQLVDISQICPF